MPDIVPIVRRPVKKLNSPPIFDKRAETESNSSSSVSGLGRKFSLPTDKSTGSGSKVKRICEGNLPVKSKVLPKREEELPVAVSFPKYDASDFVSAKQNRNVLPELRVAEAAQRVAKTTKDLELERKVLQWIMSIVNEEPSTDYDRFIQDGSILSKVMTSIVFNSVPLEQIDDCWGVNPALDRVKAVIREIRRYGVVEVFEPEDLIELRNIPAVTKCLAQLSKLAASDKNSLLSTTTTTTS